jgi:hypothetical protein
MEERKKVFLAGIIFFVLLAVAAAIYFFVFYQKPQQKEEIPEVTEKPSPTEETVEPGEKEWEYIEIELDESDELVRELANRLSSHPKLALWLMSDELIRKFVAAVDNIANGQSPRSHIDFFQPEEDFSVLEENGEYFLDTGSYQRYDIVAEVFSSLDTQGCVQLYGQLTPVIREAYIDLGYPQGDFHNTLKRAIAELQKVPVVEEKIVLEKKVVTYKLANPRLEELSPAQKHLLRMGPDNMKKIQAKLQAMSQALDSIEFSVSGGQQ